MAVRRELIAAVAGATGRGQVDCAAWTVWRLDSSQSPPNAALKSPIAKRRVMWLPEATILWVNPQSG